MSIKPNASDRRQYIGKLGETFAKTYLQNTLGWTIQCTNWRCPIGELDIVAHDGQWIVIIEVRTRTSTKFGSPLESVGVDKVRRLRRLGSYFLSSMQEGLFENRAVRFDVVGLLVRDDVVQHMKHVRFAIDM